MRAVFAGKSCIMPASVHDAISARIAQHIGYESIMLAGSVASLAVLGAPDLILLTLSEFVEQVHRITRASDLPLLVDADHGYGNALNVMRTVEELEDAGVCALSIEDTVLPRPYGDGKTRLTSIEEAVGKMKAALAGRKDPGLMIAGRTSALSVTSVEDAVARAKAYEAAGVDAVFLVGAKTRSQVEAVSSAVRLPLILGGATGELGNPAWLESQRVRVRIPPHLPFQAATQALHATMSAMRNGAVAKDIQGLAHESLTKTATRDADYTRWTAEMLGGSAKE